MGLVVGLYVGASWGETGGAIGMLLGLFIAVAVGIGAGFAVERSALPPSPCGTGRAEEGERSGRQAFARSPLKPCVMN